ncbi:MAG: Nif11-like leader peptide family RiPP precursor [Cyanobacteriota bacterium]|nr:Nif11-like leader peptide family RiPP precursor [Cyanobacteriota bacterium]
MSTVLIRNPWCFIHVFFVANQREFDYAWVDPRDWPVSKAQLNAFMLKVSGDPGLKVRVDAAVDAAAVVLIAQEEGHSFSAATWSRHLRG